MCSAVVERFAPSPTGLLHLGHAFSALTAHDAAAGGRILLRLEDIDTARSRPRFEAAIYQDLRWLGLSWETPVWRQSQRLWHYAAAVAKLTTLGLTYRCVCTRADIKAALSAPQEGVAHGPDGPVYPGTCREAGHSAAGAAIRLNIRKALQHIDDQLFYEEIGGVTTMAECAPDALIARIGDVVLARRDIGTAYHVAVVVDDAAQGVTHVTRGADLASATPIHVLLQRLLGVSTPVYRHHRLIRDDSGKRLAKRDDARAISTYRDAGETPQSVRAMLGLTPAAS